MTVASILKEKSSNKKSLLADYNLKNNKLPVGLVRINSDLIDSVLIDALKILPANFIIYWKNNNFDNNSNIVFFDDDFNNNGFDFIVCDECEDSVTDYLKVWVVPVILGSNKISSLLKEFNTWTIEGNAFIFQNNALCDIYYAIIRYTENYKFPYDNKALVKNVLAV